MNNEFNAKEEVAKLQTETKIIRHRAKKSKLIKYQSQLMMMQKEGATIAQLHRWLLKNRCPIDYTNVLRFMKKIDTHG